MSNIISKDDINYLAQQPTSKMNMILSGMTALMNDTDSKIQMIESQTWFQRMCKTISGKNKMTKEEITKNHDKINLYMAEAITVLYEQNNIDHQIIMSLGNQLNELAIEQVQLKQILAAFVNKLNEKIESVDNYHVLNKEIEQGVYSDTDPIISVCKIISQIDKRSLQDYRKMNILQRSMKAQNILSSEERTLQDYLLCLADMSMDDAGLVYLELSSIRNNFVANIILELIENYHFLPDMARKMKNKTLLVQNLIEKEMLEPGTLLSMNDIYDEFINSKLDMYENVVTIDVEKDEFAQENDKFEDSKELLALAHQYYDGDNIEQDYIKAFNLYQKAALQGEAEAMLMLFLMYESGEGIEVNLTEAITWLKKAAEAGQMDAQCILAGNYYLGNGVSQDYKMAFEWYHKAAIQGDAQSQCALANMYYNGIAVDQDYNKAFAWYAEAAEQNFAKAQYKVALCYKYGYGVEIDENMAIEWISKATNNDYSEAAETLEKWINEFIEEDYNPHSLELETNSDISLEIIKQCCDEFILSHNIKYYQREPNSMQQITIKSFFETLNRTWPPEFFLSHDDTWLGTGGNGFSITSNGVYCKAFSGKAAITSFYEICNATDIYTKNSVIYADEQPIAYDTRGYIDDLLMLFVKIRNKLNNIM